MIFFLFFKFRYLFVLVYKAFNLEILILEQKSCDVFRLLFKYFKKSQWFPCEIF
jgi:hypothetical protein